MQVVLCNGRKTIVLVVAAMRDRPQDGVLLPTCTGTCLCQDSVNLVLTPPMAETRQRCFALCCLCRRVRGKTIRFVLCNIVCNNCAQCDAHTYEQT